MITQAGPILFGYCLDIFLYGLLTVQTYLYYLAFPNDRRVTKTIVYFVYLVGMLQTAFALRDFYVLFCTQEGQIYLRVSPFGTFFPFLEGFGFMWFTVAMSGVLVASVAQLFYAHRIYVISKTKVITGAVCLLAFIQLTCGIISAVSLFHLQSDPKIVGTVNLFAGGAAGAVCDLLIAIYMSLYLSRQMKGASRTTQTFVTKVVRLLLETGILTAGMATAYMVLVAFTRHAFLVPGLSLGKLYANSILVLLNNRLTIVGGRNAPHPDFDIPSYHRSGSAGANTGPLVSRGITFASGRRTRTTLPGGTVCTVELNSQPGPVLGVSMEAANKRMETEGV